MQAVIKFDQLELEKKHGSGRRADSAEDARTSGTGANAMPVKERLARRSASLQREDEAAAAAELAAEDRNTGAGSATEHPVAVPGETGANENSDSEYEEIEVTDSEGEDEERENTKDKEDGQPPGPVEFDEDDIAYQLAAMGESYGLEPGEYGDNDDGQVYEEGAEGLPLTEEDSTALFRDLLDDWHINPYTPWEKLIEDGHIIEDERYTVLTTMKSRKEAWDAWSRDRIASIKQHRETAERQDPRIPYLTFLGEKANPKLYWPEFRRKWKKEPEMRDSRFPDKEREKLYREHINRLKLPASKLKDDLETLMKGLPIHVLNRDSSVEALPKEMLADVRFISLVPSIRDPLIREYLRSLGPAPDDTGLSAEEYAEREKRRAEREKREMAMREREKRVEEEQRKRERDLRMGRERLREGEREIEQAMKVGRSGLKAQLDGRDRQEDL